MIPYWTYFCDIATEMGGYKNVTGQISVMIIRNDYFPVQVLKFWCWGTGQEWFHHLYSS